MEKKVVILGMIFGSLIGGYLPSVFGAGIFSVYTILGSFFGGALGIYISFKWVN